MRQESPPVRQDIPDTVPRSALPAAGKRDLPSGNGPPPAVCVFPDVLPLSDDSGAVHTVRVPVAAVREPAPLFLPVSSHSCSRFPLSLSVFRFPLSVPPAILPAVFPASWPVFCSPPPHGSLHRPSLLLPPVLQHRFVLFPDLSPLSPLPVRRAVFPAAQVSQNSAPALFPHCSADSVFPAPQLFFSSLFGSVHTALSLLPVNARQRQALPPDPVLSARFSEVLPFPAPYFLKLPAVLFPAGTASGCLPVRRNTVCFCFSVLPAHDRRSGCQRSGKKFLFVHRTLPAAAAENPPARSSRSA